MLWLLSTKQSPTTTSQLLLLLLRLLLRLSKSAAKTTQGARASKRTSRGGRCAKEPRRRGLLLLLLCRLAKAAHTKWRPCLCPGGSTKAAKGRGGLLLLLLWLLRLAKGAKATNPRRGRRTKGGWCRRRGGGTEAPKQIGLLLWLRWRAKASKPTHDDGLVMV